jgi:hypothetical protein
MQGVRVLGTILLILGLIGVVWGIIEMNRGKEIDPVRDVETVSDGGFPTIGTAGAIGVGLGVIMLIGAGMAGRRSS